MAQTRSRLAHAPNGLLLGKALGEVGIVALVLRVDRHVAVLRIAAIADRDRADAGRDDPVDDDAREQRGREPDPAEAPADEERRGERDAHDQAAEPLVEILLEEERAVAAEDAALDALGTERTGRVGGVRAPAARALELACGRPVVLGVREAIRAVEPRPHELGLQIRPESRWRRSGTRRAARR